MTNSREKHNSQVMLPLDGQSTQELGLSKTKKKEGFQTLFIALGGEKDWEKWENTQKGMVGSDQVLGLVEKPGWPSSSSTCEP